MTMPSGTTPLARKQLIALFIKEIVVGGRLELADEIFATDFCWPQFGLRGPDGVRSWLTAFRKAFPDISETVQEQVAEGDAVVTKVEVTGTQVGPFLGLPPSGRQATFTVVGIDRFRGEKVVEREAYFDMVDLMRQLGHQTLVLPAAAPATRESG